MTCVDVPELRAAFERSNLSEDAWAGAARLVDGMCAVEISLVFSQLRETRRPTWKV
jgi:hypothetical protein